MEVRYSVHPEHGKQLDTAELQRKFKIEGLFSGSEVNMTYSHIDRIVIGGVSPVKPVDLAIDSKMFGVEYFLERREMGVINVGGSGVITVDGHSYDLDYKDCLYVGKGSKQIRFESNNSQEPSKYYFLSGTAHKEYKTKLIVKADANIVDLGSVEEANKRKIFQFIHPDVLETCQLSMGFTELAEGSVWNTMPSHTHERRMEVYFYFEVPSDGVVFHLMGQPEETRHIVMRNNEAVISPSWSIHSGVGTSKYTFIWGMVGENQTFTDMDHVPMTEIS